MKPSYLETLEAQLQTLDSEIATMGPLEITDLDHVTGGGGAPKAIFNTNDTCRPGHFDSNGTCK